MGLPDKQSIENLFFKLGCVVTLIVLGLSLYHGYSMLFITLRTVLAFVVVHMIGIVIISVWVKISPPPPAKPDKFHSTFDVLLGDPDEEDSSDALDTAPEDLTTQELSTNDSKGGVLRKAYGNNLATDGSELLIAGQINTSMKNGLKDDANKAEIGRRMGLESSSQKT